MDVSNAFLSEEMLDSLLLMPSGILRRMERGWLLSRCTYWGVLLGLVYGCNDKQR